MYLHVIEDNKGNILLLQATIGKAGSIANAWAAGVCDMITHLLKDMNVPLDRIISLLSNSRSGDFRLNDGVAVFSGLHGIGFALSRYKQLKYQESLDEGSVEVRRMVRRVG